MVEQTVLSLVIRGGGNMNMQVNRRKYQQCGKTEDNKEESGKHSRVKKSKHKILDAEERAGPGGEDLTERCKWVCCICPCQH